MKIEMTSSGVESEAMRLNLISVVGRLCEIFISRCRRLEDIANARNKMASAETYPLSGDY